jgi:multiple sugar transport system substrate-binding protein
MQPYSRRRALVGGAVGVVAAACGPSGTGTSGASGPSAGGGAIKPGTHLSFASWGGPDVQDLSKRYADAFRTKHPGVTAEFISTDGPTHNEKITAAAAANTPIDVFYLNPGDTPTFAEQGLIRPIGDLVKRDRYDIADFYEKCIGQYNWRGHLYGLPRGFGNQDIYYNTAMWDGAGIKHPPYDWNSTSWTVDEFLAAGQRLARTGSESQPVWGWTQGTGLRQWGPWVWIFGGDILNKDGTTCILDQTPAVEGLQFLQDLIHKHRVMAPPSLKLNAVSVLGSGQLGMAMGIPANLSNYRKQQGLNFDVAPMPRKAARLTSGGGIAWHMGKATASVDGAWELLKVVAGPDFQKEECAAGSVAPPRKSILKSSCFVDRNLPPKGIDEKEQAPEFVHPDPQTLGWTEAEDTVNAALRPVWEGTQTARQVAQDVVPQVNRILKQYAK